MSRLRLADCYVITPVWWDDGTVRLLPKDWRPYLKGGMKGFPPER